jgi:thiamine pyrophosphate-dependent acetolactate synthase large subunit-like protein
MKIKAMNGIARILKAEGVPWISCYPTSPINNALGEEGVPIYMMGEERFGIAVADAYSRVTCGKQIGVCTAMAGLNAAGIQMAFGAIAQAWEDSSPVLIMVEGLNRGASRHTHFDIAAPNGSARSIAPTSSPTTCAARSLICARGGPVRCCSSCRATSVSTKKTSIPIRR